MSDTWQDRLRAAQRQFQQHAGRANLWHGLLIHSSPPDEDVGDGIREHEPHAWLPRAGNTTICWAGADEMAQVMSGGIHGEKDLLLPFRGLANAVYRVLLSSPLATIAQVVERPANPRDYSDCWIGVLYHLAWTYSSPLLCARIRHGQIHSWLDCAEDEPHIYYTHSWIEQDLYAASDEAIRLLLEATPAETKQQKPALTKEEANEMVKQYLALPRNRRRERTKDKRVSLRELATHCGCSTGLISKTPAWIKFQADRDERDGKKAPRAVNYSSSMDAKHGEGRKDEVLEQVAEKEERDRQKALNDLIAESQRDNASDPSPLDPDPPGHRTKKVRERKKA